MRITAAYRPKVDWFVLRVDGNCGSHYDTGHLKRNYDCHCTTCEWHAVEVEFVRAAHGNRKWDPDNRFTALQDTRQADLRVDPSSRLKSICTFQVGSDHFSLPSNRICLAPVGFMSSRLTVKYFY